MKSNSLKAGESRGFYKLSWVQRIGFGSGGFGSEPYLPDGFDVPSNLLHQRFRTTRSHCSGHVSDCKAS